MENREITERRIRASSEFGDASRGRLHSETEGWQPTQNDANQWLQVDLGNQHTNVTRIATQGRNDGDQWVTKYKLQYGNDTANLQNYTEQGRNTEKVKRFFFLCYIRTWKKPSLQKYKTLSRKSRKFTSISL